MALADSCNSSRVPSNWRESVWPSFEADVLEYVDHGCQLLQAETETAEWKERDYTWALIRHLERTNVERWEYLSPRYDEKALTDMEFAAGKSPHTAPMIDLVVRWHYREPEPSFAIEAKVLVASGVGAYKPWDTVHDYVAEGMNRFVDGKYAGGLPSGAMVAYLLSGTPEELAIKINERIASLPLACDIPLRVHKADPLNRPKYESKHPRATRSQIRLLHTFLVF
jgi:hypothetical protein